MLFDRKTEPCVFEPGDQVLALLPLVGSSFQAKFSGPYTVNRHTLSCTNLIEHDIDVGDAKPIKQRSYWLPIGKCERMEKEVEYIMAAWTVWILLMCAALTGQGSKAQDCGMAPLNTKVVGGDNATAGAWPWQVSIHLGFAGIVQQHICGGTLISDQWVLTAAHCIIINSTSAWTLYLGRETQSGPNNNEVSRSVTQVIIHPDYNNTLFNNDIALMKLSSPVIYTNYIRPICLASNSSQFHNATLCWATGWGKLSRNESLPDSFKLQEVQIPVIGSKECSCDYIPEPAANITDEMICAGQENKGTCQGDSGGPLQCKQNSMWIQAGITSFGVPCATGDFPEVYARVSEFQSWIIAQVAGANVSFVTFTSSGTDPDSSFVCRSGNTTTSTAPTIATELALVVLSATVSLQHILAP
ncbi:chymotrypsin-like protease CTRL-1 [Symphorus nematophorus]